MQNQISICDILDKYGDAYITKKPYPWRAKRAYPLIVGMPDYWVGSHFESAVIAVTWVNHTTRAVTGIAQPVSKKINWSGSINA